jgi:hypothetical protein
MFSFSRRRVGLVLVVAFLLIPAAAFAAQRFNDVPPSSVFYGDIEWLADKGITKGCNPPANTLFCPEDFVKRQQMAAFMHRAESLLGTRYAGNFGTTVPLPNDTDTLVAVTTIGAPSDGGAITIKGMASIEEGTADQYGMVWAEVNNGGRCNLASPVGGTFPAFWDTLDLGFASSVVTGGVPVPAGAYRIDLCAWGIGPTSEVGAEIEVTWIATGATGGDVQYDGKATLDSGDGKFNIDELKSRISNRARG